MSYPACLLTLQVQQIWDDLPQTTINKAINDRQTINFRKRLNVCVSADGGHVEHIIILCELGSRA